MQADTMNDNKKRILWGRELSEGQIRKMCANREFVLTLLILHKFFISMTVQNNISYQYHLLPLTEAILPAPKYQTILTMIFCHWENFNHVVCLDTIRLKISLEFNVSDFLFLLKEVVAVINKM